MPSPVRVAIGLGVNLGDRVSALARALDLLCAADSPVIFSAQISPLFESEALLLPDAPAAWNIPFLNIVLVGVTATGATDLLMRVKAVESELGRKQRDRWAPREIDIDILAYGTEQIELPNLKIPHAEMRKRPFVIDPFYAVDPEFAHTLQLPLSVAGSVATKSAAPLVQKRFAALLNSAVDSSCVKKAALAAARTEIVGVLNCTPDSFSDGGIIDSPEHALFRAQALLDAGATILDIGAESTRPGAAPITISEEQHRLFPILEPLLALRADVKKKFAISVDTRHALTARAAAAMKVDWLNDVSGFGSKEMIAAAADSACKVVLMHNLGIPPAQDRILDASRAAMPQVAAWFEEHLTRLEGSGIERARVILDPGVGFGKSQAQSFELLRDVEQLWCFGLPVLIGHSRKSFLTAVTTKPAAQRDSETAVLSGDLARRGVDYLRVHNVEATAAAIGLMQKLGALD